MSNPFCTSREHLYAEMFRLDLMIQRQVWRWRQANADLPPTDGEFRGIYISDAEIDALFAGVYPGSDQIAHPSFDSAILERISTEIAHRRADSLHAGIALSLDRLRERLGLTPLDMDIVLLGLAPELDLRYSRFFAYLQDDVTRKRPSVSLALNLFCETPQQRLDARPRFAPNAPLLHHQVIALFNGPAQPHAPLLAQYFKLDPGLVEFLLRDADPLQPFEDARTRAISSWTLPSPSLAALPLETTTPPDAPGDWSDPSLGTRLVALRSTDRRLTHRVAQSLCARWNSSLLTVHLTCLADGSDDMERMLRRLARNAHLVGAAIYWDGYSDWAQTDDRPTAWPLDDLHRVIREYPAIHILPVEQAHWQPDHILLSTPRLAQIHLPTPTYAMRRALWQHHLGSEHALPDADIAAVSGMFRLDGSQIQDAVQDACHRAQQRPPDQRHITAADLFAAARARSGDQLGKLARRIEPCYTWADLVLPDERMAQLCELGHHMRYRPVVMGEWGFERKMALGKGLNVLLAGPSGTGKTMAAQVIAADLQLELYQIDLSTIVSKYVGETEKNLERIFAAAYHSNAILLFDEADALFGKRSEVRDAHDRYANVEISYLLQKMEAYDGLVILTTNLSKNMDEAFLRRMHFTIEFPYPDATARQRIWQLAFPPQAPLAADVDTEQLAARYPLSGGNIRNIALTAAFLAAGDGGAIHMQHILWATRREFQKMGRLVDKREFDIGQ